MTMVLEAYSCLFSSFNVITYSARTSVIRERMRIAIAEKERGRVSDCSV
jgi:hypothetical protein